MRLALCNYLFIIYELLHNYFSVIEKNPFIILKFVVIFRAGLVFMATILLFAQCLYARLVRLEFKTSKAHLQANLQSSFSTLKFQVMRSLCGKQKEGLED